MTSPLTRAALDELRAMLAAATPGPWRVVDGNEYDETNDTWWIARAKINDRDYADSTVIENRSDAEWWAALLNAAPALLDAAQDAMRYKERFEAACRLLERCAVCNGVGATKLIFCIDCNGVGFVTVGTALAEGKK